MLSGMIWRGFIVLLDFDGVMEGVFVVLIGELGDVFEDGIEFEYVVVGFVWCFDFECDGCVYVWSDGVW